MQRLPFLAYLEHESFQAGVPTKLLFFEASHETRDNLQESQLENCFLLWALTLAILEASMNPIIGSNKSRTFQTLLNVDQDRPCLFCAHTDLPMTSYPACTTTSTSRVSPLTQFHTPLPLLSTPLLCIYRGLRAIQNRQSSHT